jgi:hypothetical protein
MPGKKIFNWAYVSWQAIDEFLYYEYFHQLVNYYYLLSDDSALRKSKQILLQREKQDNISLNARTVMRSPLLAESCIVDRRDIKNEKTQIDTPYCVKMIVKYWQLTSFHFTRSLLTCCQYKYTFFLQDERFKVKLW